MSAPSSTADPTLHAAHFSDLAITAGCWAILLALTLAEVEPGPAAGLESGAPTHV